MRPPIVAVAPPVRAILPGADAREERTTIAPNSDVPQLNQLITTIIGPLQEREEQTLNQEVQLQQGYETINTLVLAPKVVIEHSKAALPADSAASNPVTLALTICETVADNLH
jgi:hypothetical protein